MPQPKLFSLRFRFGPLRAVVIPLECKSDEWVRRALNVRAGDKMRLRGKEETIVEVSIHRGRPVVCNGDVIECGRAWLDSPETIELAKRETEKLHGARPAPPNMPPALLWE